MNPINLHTSPSIIRDFAKLHTIRDIDPNKWYRAWNLANTPEFLATYGYPEAIYRIINAGEITIAILDGTKRALIQGKEFIRFLSL